MTTTQGQNRDEDVNDTICPRKTMINIDENKNKIKLFSSFFFIIQNEHMNIIRKSITNSIMMLTFRLNCVVYKKINYTLLSMCNRTKRIHFSFFSFEFIQKSLLALNEWLERKRRKDEIISRRNHRRRTHIYRNFY